MNVHIVSLFRTFNSHTYASFLTDPEVFAFSETTTLTFKSGSTVTASLSFEIKNVGSTVGTNNGNGILSVSGIDNYEFQVALSDKDMETSADTLGLSPLSVSTTVNKEQALAAGASFTGTGTAAVMIPSAQCTQIDYLCFLLVIPAGAKYIDKVPAASSNAKCQLISARIACSPGM